MPAIEWVSLYEAADRLQTFWTIPASIAEKIVVNVVHGGSAQVRAKDRHQASLVPQIVTGQIQLSRAGVLALSHVGPWALSQAGSWAPDYEEIEIDWNGLLEEGRKLLPSWISVPSTRRARNTSNKSTSKRKAAQRRGPLPGTINRYNDESLFPEIDRMTEKGRMSVNAATLKLAYDGKVEGSGTKENNARRLAHRYRRYRQKRNSLPLASTRPD